MDEHIESNRKNWNERTSIHAKSKFYNVEGFKSGQNTLKSVEVQELGDVKGKSLLHFQCHFGLDTLSFARLGAKVTGVDFSDRAIDFAKSLSEETGLKAEFICSDIYELPKILTEKFDIVFASYGVFCWISDVDQWMKIASDFLKPNGVLYVIDNHPVSSIFESDFKVEYSYFNSGKPMKFEPEGTYADRSADIPTSTYQWTHSLSDIINAVINAGLEIEFVHEFPFGQWDKFRNMMKEENGWYVMKDRKVKIPLLFSIKANKS